MQFLTHFTENASRLCQWSMTWLVSSALVMQNQGSAQSSSAPAPSGSISSTLRPVSAASCSTIVR
jgi:hypothetical protein